jgi:hypothetical protein
MNDSNLFSLGWKDAAKGLLMAVLTPVFCDSTIKTQVL